MTEHIGRLTAAGYTKGSGTAKLRLEGTEETIVVEIPDGETATDLADVALDVEDALDDSGGGLGSLLSDGGEGVSEE